VALTLEASLMYREFRIVVPAFSNSPRTFPPQCVLSEKISSNVLVTTGTTFCLLVNHLLNF
jgi:hypothetical protein